MLCVTQEVHTDILPVQLAVVRADARAEVISWTQRPAAGVLDRQEVRRVDLLILFRTM